MSFFQSIFLGILQGITEFLPISSSGHLILVEHWMGLKVDELKSFDVALHMGTLLAILLYFWKDFYGMLMGIFGKKIRSLDMPFSESISFYRRLFIFLVIGTIPAILAGVFFGDTIDAVFRNNTKAVALMLFFVALLFFLAERHPREKKKTEIGLKETILTGIAQSFALIPGVSRSGATITAGLFQGLTRQEAARFSFLLGAPAIFGAGVWTLMSGVNGTDFSLLFGGFISAAISGIFVIHFLMNFLKKYGLSVFAWYRIALSIVVFML